MSSTTAIKDIIIKAYSFAEKAHEGVERKFSGLPYFSHVKFVARTLEKLHVDSELVAAGFLHDVIEDTDTTYEQVNDKFGKRVADLVLELTNNFTAMKAAGGKRLYMAQKLVKMSDDALTIKLADRFHNVLFMEQDSTPEKFIKKYYKETRFILFALEESDREFNEIQLALVARISAILEFLRIRYEFE